MDADAASKNQESAENVKDDKSKIDQRELSKVVQLGYKESNLSTLTITTGLLGNLKSDEENKTNIKYCVVKTIS